MDSDAEPGSGVASLEPWGTGSGFGSARASGCFCGSAPRANAGEEAMLERWALPPAVSDPFANMVALATPPFAAERGGLEVAAGPTRPLGVAAGEALGRALALWAAAASSSATFCGAFLVEAAGLDFVFDCFSSGALAESSPGGREDTKRGRGGGPLARGDEAS